MAHHRYEIWGKEYLSQGNPQLILGCDSNPKGLVKAISNIKVKYGKRRIKRWYDIEIKERSPAAPTDNRGGAAADPANSARPPGS